VKIGEVYLVEIPAIGGHEQAGYRPAIIFQSEQRLEELPTVLIIPVTSKTKAVAFPYTLLIKSDQENNLSSASVALVFQLRAIDKRRLKHKIGSLKNNDIIRIKQLIKKMMMLDKA
jgi:mRNA interferase MazF